MPLNRHALPRAAICRSSYFFPGKRCSIHTTPRQTATNSARIPNSKNTAFHFDICKNPLRSLLSNIFYINLAGMSTIFYIPNLKMSLPFREDPQHVEKASGTGAPKAPSDEGAVAGGDRGRENGAVLSISHKNANFSVFLSPSQLR